MEYTVTWPEGMVMERDHKVIALVEFPGKLDMMDDIPRRVAICECKECGKSGVIIWGERHTGEWIVNWNVSRPLASILLGIWAKDRKS